MDRHLQITADGSHTLAIPELGLTYHSHHGAVQESMHVYIDAGLLYLINAKDLAPVVHILEIGFGTGLNALLSVREAIKHRRHIHYTAIEKYPLTELEAQQLNHGRILNMQLQFEQIHHAPWEQAVVLHPYFTLEKKQRSLPGSIGSNGIHCIYFDAFSPTAQPEMWTQDFFELLYQGLLPGGILLTYCSKSSIRKAMVAAGFRVSKIQGPWGKREMVRAEKISN